MRDINRQSTSPVKFPRSRRNHALAVLTSFMPGKCVPLAAIPMLREDALSASMRINLEMLETKEILMNPVTARVTAYVVPWLAMERFEGSLDQFNRSYAGEPQVEGGDVVPFFNMASAELSGGGLAPFYKALGMHVKAGTSVNTMYLEAYNQIFNFRLKNRSPKLWETEKVALNSRGLNPAFWNHSRFAHVVPDFDQAVIDGEVALNFVRDNLPGQLTVNTSSVSNAEGSVVAPLYLRQDGHTYNSSLYPGGSNFPGSGVQTANLKGFANLNSFYNALEAEGFRLSLSNLELARKTQTWAEIRKQFDGFDDEYITDMLMSGLSIPDQNLKQPILLADKTVRFGQAKRYATDSGNLDDSATSGAAYLDLNIRCPRLHTGGIVIVQVEVLPEQLWERQDDAFLRTSTVAGLPDALRDHLDPEKVDVVTNGEIDVSHASPSLTFGYAPLNWKWNAAGPRIGGKFLRPSADAPLDDARQRIWAVEGANPTLGSSFYICKSLHIKPFLDQTTDPFEVTVMGNAVLDGLTQFGGVLVEATDNYEKVMDKAPMDRIEKASS